MFDNDSLIHYLSRIALLKVGPLFETLARLTRVRLRSLFFLTRAITSARWVFSPVSINPSHHSSRPSHGEMCVIMTRLPSIPVYL